MDEPELLSRLLYRDALMLVLDKPAGMPVHKGSGGGETLDQHFNHLRFGLPRPPALAHRLDRATSGCLVLGRNRHALATLGKLFEKGRMEKTYWAIVDGQPPDETGLIDIKLAKKTEASHRWHMKPDPNGMEALTEYRLLGRFGHTSWLELKPRTGRTHQLRVHCAALGCPIIGDMIYGSAAPDRMLQLLARQVTIPLYPKKDPISVTAPVPPHMGVLNTSPTHSRGYDPSEYSSAQNYCEGLGDKQWIS